MMILERAPLFLRRFHARRDAYGVGKLHRKEDGTYSKVYHPQCANYWDENKCHIRKKTGVQCGNCEHRAYAPVTEETVSRHLSGEEQQLFYLLHTDGTVKYSGLDFDNKPERPHHAYSFDEVRKVSDLMDSMGIPHGIARSTNLGFHIFTFFSDFVRAAKVRSVFLHVFEVAGFMEQQRMGTRPAPELFPKAAFVSNGGLGNGIVPPLSLARMKLERNCFVDKNNVMIPLEKQWEHFTAIPNVDPAVLDKIIMDNALDVDDRAAVSTTGNAKRASSGHNGAWVPPLTGSIEKVLEGCAAFRKIKQECQAGKVPGHEAGFSLFRVCMATADGMEYFDKVPGWGTTEKDRRQLEHHIGKNYSPSSCQTMQEKGLCIPGTKCFNKKPPIIMVDGQPVPDDSVQEKDWPSPSPIRFSWGRGVDFLKLLMDEASHLSKEQDASIRLQKIRELMRRAQVFDIHQQNDLMTYLKDLKLAKKSDLIAIQKEFAKQDAEKFREAAAQHDDIAVVAGTVYQKREPHGYSAITRVKGKEIEKILCDFDLRILEERTYWDDGHQIDKQFFIDFRSTSNSIETEVTSAVWADNRQIFAHLIAAAGPSFNPLPDSIPMIRQAAQAFLALTRFGGHLRRVVYGVRYARKQGTEKASAELYRRVQGRGGSARSGRGKDRCPGCQGSGADGDVSSELG